MVQGFLTRRLTSKARRINNVQTSPRDRASDVEACVPFWTTSTAAESKLWSLPTTASTSASCSSSRNLTPRSWFSIQRTGQKPSREASWQSSRCFQLARMVCARTRQQLSKSLRIHHNKQNVHEEPEGASDKEEADYG